jgi:ubiquinone/menaquinone biosynthesis C-methylase UbiE
MKTQQTSRNPFPPGRYAYAWEVVAAAAPRLHLDYGAYDGAVAASFVRTGATRTSVAADPNRHALAASEPIDGVVPITISTNGKLPLRSGSIDCVTMLDVLEHILDQGRVLAEIHRVLRPDGVLVVTVPRRHMFSVLDTGNWKFYLPRLHRLVYSVTHGRASYAQRYVECQNGLFGDIEVGKTRHEHFSESSLTSLLSAHGFAIADLDGGALFGRVLALVALVPIGSVRRIARRVQVADARRFRSANLFATATPIAHLASSEKR